MVAEDPEKGAAPTRSILEGAYNQTYVIRTVEDDKRSKEGGKEADSDSDDEAEYDERRVLFRCGNWCYTGHVTLENSKVALTELPRVIPALQRQQNRLHFYCNASAVPRDSSFREPMVFLQRAADFAAAELASDRVHHELAKWNDVYTWMENDSTNTYFELQCDPPSCMRGIALAASKTYARGMVFMTVYFEGSMYVVVQDGEGDQPLLDVKFPDVSQPGQGVHILSYAGQDDDEELGVSSSSRNFEATKLTLWHSLAAAAAQPRPKVSPIKTTNLATDSYIQMYTILKANDERGDRPGRAALDNSHHDVLFRFGSWCYAGSVQLTPIIDLADLPHIIPALRVQQSRLDFVCDASAMPTHSPFAKPMRYLADVYPLIEQELVSAEDVLRKLLAQFASMEAGSSLNSWLDGDAGGSFFEFQLVLDKDLERAFRNVELVASKTYGPSGVVVVTIYYEKTIYVVLSESSGEQPLLDSRFPDVSSKGRGYLVASHAHGLSHWPQLRKVAVWQTAAAMKSEMTTSGAPAAAKGVEPAAAETRAPASSQDAEASRATAAPAPAEAKDPDLSKAKTPAKRVPTNDNDDDGSPFSLRAQANHDPTFVSKREEQRKETAENKADVASTDSAGPATDAQPKRNPLLASLKPLDRKVNAPHHVPPIAGLNNKLDAIRKKLGTTGGEAPWDEFGRPKVMSFKK